MSYWSILLPIDLRCCVDVHRAFASPTSIVIPMLYDRASIFMNMTKYAECGSDFLQAGSDCVAANTGTAYRLIKDLARRSMGNPIDVEYS